MHTKIRAPNDHITLKDNNKVIRDQNQVAETLNDYFTNITKNLNMSGIKHFKDQTHANNIPVISDTPRTF